MTPELATDHDVAALSDADLVQHTRGGDADAFAELWRRHYRSGISVARSVTSSLDPDDLVQESFTRIYQSIKAGSGPTGSFRAYLFTSIRNTAATWGRARRETAIDTLESVEDPATSEQATAEALDRSLTNQAFRSLPTRWQEVLWYTEIEQMKPAEVAPLLGMKATAVAQLAFRAREGLREAWIQAHLRVVEDGSDCQWTIEQLGSYARSNSSRRDRARIDAHLRDCARCTIVAAEAQEVSDRLALVLLPLTVGIAGTAGYLASLQGGAVSSVALAAMPSAVAGGAVTAAPVGEAPTAAAGGASAGGGGLNIGAAVGLAAATVVVIGGVFAGAAALVGAGTGTGAAESAQDAASAGLGIDAHVDMPDAADDPLVPEAVEESETSPTQPESPDQAPPADAGDTADDPGTTPVDGTTTAPGSSPGGAADDPLADGSAPIAAAAGLPDGVPAIVSSTSAAAGDGTVTISVRLQGEPGATVRARTHGDEVARTTLDGSGTGVVVVSASAQDVSVGTRLELRYVSGDLVGSPAGVKLADLL